MKRKFFLFGFTFFIAVGFLKFHPQNEDIFLKINKSVEVFGKIYKEVILNYVDEVDPRNL
jgi:hypothetical protein